MCIKSKPHKFLGKTLQPTTMALEYGRFLKQDVKTMNCKECVDTFDGILGSLVKLHNEENKSYTKDQWRTCNIVPEFKKKYLKTNSGI